MMFVRDRLYDALGEHGVGNLHEAGHVCAAHEVDGAVRLAAIAHALVVNVRHNLVETVVHFLGRPRDVHGVLRAEQIGLFM